MLLARLSVPNVRITVFVQVKAPPKVNVVDVPLTVIPNAIVTPADVIVCVLLKPENVNDPVVAVVVTDEDKVKSP